MWFSISIWSMAGCLQGGPVPLTAQDTATVVVTEPSVSSTGLETPSLDVDFGMALDLKQFKFAWRPEEGASAQQLWEIPAPNMPERPIGVLDPAQTEFVHDVPLFARQDASYVLESCKADRCLRTAPIGPGSDLKSAIGHIKPLDTGSGDRFGSTTALSADGRTLVIGAPQHDGGGDVEADRGNAYVFVRDPTGRWAQQASLSPIVSEAGDRFGACVAISASGDVVAVSSPLEDGSSPGVNGMPNNNFRDTGAVYVFVRDADTSEWDEHSIIKSTNLDSDDDFGFAIALSDDGMTLAVGAPNEDGATRVVDGPRNDDATNAGAVYLYHREPSGSWAPTAYIKPFNTDAADQFGFSVALDASGGVLAVGAPGEDGAAQEDDAAAFANTDQNSGAAYVFTGASDEWTQRAYVKASTNSTEDAFGHALALSDDGNTLVVSATEETGLPFVPQGGMLHVFTQTVPSGWSATAQLRPPAPLNGERLGMAVSMSADGRFIAAATSVDRVWVFDDDGVTYRALPALIAPRSDTNFGVSVALSGDGSALLVGADQDNSDETGVTVVATANDGGALAAGAAFLY